MTNITDKDIASFSLIEYLNALHDNASCFNLTTDLSHWAELGITTAKDLADYLDQEA